MKLSKQSSKLHEGPNQKVSLLVFGLIIVAAFWWIVNLNEVPRYGDTPEYIKLSQTLAVDSWRTLAYPLILRVFSIFDSITITRFFVYVLQTIVAVLSAYYFFKTLDLLNDTRLRRNRLLLLSAMLVSMPLLAHFSVSILTDSLMNSLLIISIMSLARLIFLKDSSFTTVAVVLSSFFATSLMRQERTMFFAVFLVFGLYFLVKSKPNHRRIAVYLSAFFVVLLAGYINKLTQRTDLGRPPVSITSSVFERTVRGNLHDNLSSMPSVIRQRITPQLAQDWDRDQKHTLKVFSLLEDPTGQSAMRHATIASVRCCGHKIAYHTLGDFLEYIFAPLAYMKETIVRGAPRASWTKWTNTRLAMAHPPLSYFYIYYSFLVFIIAAIIAYKNRVRLLGARAFIVYIGVVIVIQALMFAAGSSIDFHIRYALPIYTLEVGLLIWLAFGASGTKTQIEKAKYRRKDKTSLTQKG